MHDSIVVRKKDSFLMSMNHSFKFEAKVYASIDNMNVIGGYARVMPKFSYA